ncbi:LysR family transcriptional regulator [Persicobacter sp. CCB-QB2]|uniref:LysR family transcriptional regulator n=1 Tax=Persicobacter sp. CCB-QB2 TaxID=1561025 RepID=UPI000B0E828E|nr:LysR family transcriptional regulator [Persicobacter sp. CCB-QB2]
MMLNISLTQMEYIVAVDTHRHFVTAAEHCFVTQPTLSMQIKKLEDQLGVTIFDRTKQPIIPTDAGAKIIKQARIILNEVERINDILQEYRDTVAGELKIGIIPTLAPYLVPRFIGNFYKAFQMLS